MRHAIGALLILAGAVGIPIGGVHQLLEGLGVALAQQVAGFLPAEDVARRHSPRRAFVILVAGQEVEEQAGVHEIPLLALAQRKHVAEQFLGLGAIEEVLLVRRALIGIAGRHRDADPELGGEIEKLGDLLRRMPVEDGGVDVDRKAARLGGLDRRHGAVEHALLRHRLVVMLLQAVEMDGEEQIGRGLEQVELLLEQQRVGAERDELLARDEPAHDLADLLVDQRLAARDRHHRRSAFIGGVPALLRAHAAVEDRIGIVDLAAADAGQVAAEQGLQHQHQRIALAAHQLLLDQVAADLEFFEEGYCHYKGSFWSRYALVQLAANSAGSRNSMFSSRPGSTETATGPIRRSASMTSSTRTSGADAPAVTPTAFAPFSHSGLSSLPSAMR